MNTTNIKISILVLLMIGTPNASRSSSGQQKDPYAGVSAEQKQQLQTRLADYVKAYRNHDWPTLYGLVSAMARGGVARERFVARMKAEHGEEFSSFPDLLEFAVDRTIKGNDNQYDVYGCGKARRERMDFKGIALVHAAFERNNWYFTGWSFTEFPNEPCKLLKDPSWELPGPMEWGEPMGELRGEHGVKFHTDNPK